MTYILCLTCLHFASFIGRQAAILQTTKEDPALFLQRYRPPVLIDEIQKAPKLFPYIMEIVDASDQTGTVWLTGSQPFHLMKEVSESLAGHAGVIEMLGLSSAGISGVSSESFSPGRDYFVLRVTVSKPYDVAEAYDRICAGSLPGIRSLPKDLRAGAYESYLDTGLAAYLTGWTSPQALETGTMSGQVFETHVFGEIYKSFLNAGQQAPLYFFRNNDKKEIDLLMERDGTLFPIEVKKTASPSRKDARNLNVLDPVNAPDVAPELSMFKRDIGTGAIVCLAQDTLPVSERAWAFPVWAI